MEIAFKERTCKEGQRATTANGRGKTHLLTERHNSGGGKSKEEER